MNVARARDRVNKVGWVGRKQNHQFIYETESNIVCLEHQVGGVEYCERGL